MRVRKHTNPFNFHREMPKLQIEELFPAPKQPLHLDIGFAHGEFILESAKQNPEWNYLGLEVRTPLVEKIEKLIEEQALHNCKVVAASSLMNLDIIPDNSLDRVTTFFCDPWFKPRHHKRRIINAKFLSEIPAKLKHGATILFQTDVENLYLDTLEYINENGHYTIILNENGVHHPNPLGIQSYFEAQCLKNQWPIYRMEFRVAIA